jgi:hypothetical protein
MQMRRNWAYRDTDVIPGRRGSGESQMCNCASANPWIPGSMLRIAPE